MSDTQIDTSNDAVRVYRDASGGWRWHRFDLSNGRILSSGAGDGYVDQDYAEAAARAYNADVPEDRVRIVDDGASR